ncbi:MAG: hypothetical protein AAGF92_08940 [Myxococcota bacterium]
MTVTLDELPCEEITETGSWVTAPLPPLATGECAWFLFEDNTTYIFEHPLGRVPDGLANSLIAFDDDGVNSTPPSGDVFLFVGADESTITVRNGQNQTFFLRLVAN